MNNSATVASMIEEAMMKKQGGKDRFNMTGQYASPVMYDEETGREYVIYESPNGEDVKVFGNWNEYAVSVDDDGNDLIGDMNFPVMMNKDGEYVLDEKGLEERRDSRPQGDQGMMEEADSLEDTEEEGMAEEMEGGEGQPPSEEEQAMMQSMGGGMPMAMGGMDMRKKLMMALGGKIYANGGSVDTDPEKERRRQESRIESQKDARYKEIMGDTIISKKRELDEASRDWNRGGRTNYEQQQRVNALQKEYDTYRKELEDYRNERMATRRRSEEQRGTITFANGGFVRPTKRY